MKLILAYGLPAAGTGAAAAREFTPGEMPRTPTFYLMWLGFALGCSAGLMVISQLAPFAKSVGIAAGALSTMTLVVGALGNASGRILSEWMSDRLGRINVLRTMIAICIAAMPALYAAGSNVALRRSALHSTLNWRCRDPSHRRPELSPGWLPRPATRAR